MEAHLSKYRSLMPKLALIFEVCETIHSTGEMAKVIEVEATELAIEWCQFLESHARKAYGEFIEPEITAGRRLLKKLKSGAVKDFDRLRDIYRHGWKGLSTSAELELAVETLESYGWVRKEMLTPSTGRRSEVLRLHPALRVN